MSVLNYTYGILTGGAVGPGIIGYRKCDDVLYTSQKQKEAIDYLIYGRDEVSISLGANMMIQLLECSDHFSAYINTYDPVNTYNTHNTVVDVTDVNTDLSKINTVSYTELLSWADNKVVATSEKYAIRPSDDGITRITNALFSVLTMKA
jgi:hypothetical protein